MSAPLTPVYLDNAATTRVDDEVARAMVEAMTVDYGNPSSSHALGIAAGKRLERARAQVAAAIGADARDVYFTSGGTEANAIGVRGAAGKARGRHAIVSAIEHPSVIEAARRLVGEGWTLDEIAVDAGGVIDLAALAAKLTPETALVAVMLVSNELGTVQPVWEIARRVKQIAPRAHVHVDAVQALGKVPLDVKLGPIDSLAVSAHKIHGPKGAGALWLRRGAQIVSLTVGGGQEKGIRPGTEGMPGAVGLGVAAEAASNARAAAATVMNELRARLVAGASLLHPAMRVNGDPERSAPHIVSLGFPGVPAEPLLHALEARGVFVSAGSACHAKDRKPSATLRAIGVPDDVGVLRVSLSRHTTAADVDRALAALASSLRELA